MWKIINLSDIIECKLLFKNHKKATTKNWRKILRHSQHLILSGIECNTTTKQWKSKENKNVAYIVTHMPPRFGATTLHVNIVFTKKCVIYFQFFAQHLYTDFISIKVRDSLFFFFSFANEWKQCILLVCIALSLFLMSHAMCIKSQIEEKKKNDKQQCDDFQKPLEIFRSFWITHWT